MASTAGIRDYDAKADRIFIHRLKGTHSGHHPLMREEGRALPDWRKMRGAPQVRSSSPYTSGQKI